jgi:IS1 family transposase
MFNMNRLSNAERAKILGCLVEGNSVRSTCRITGAAKGTVLKLLEDVGYACDRFQDEALRALNCKRIQCDEIWSFVGAKEKNVPREQRGLGFRGDVWTWTAIDADSKLAVSWLVGNRSYFYAKKLMEDLQGRLASRVQLTTDGHKVYLQAVEKAFAGEVDYAMLVKLYGAPEGTDTSRSR